MTDCSHEIKRPLLLRRKAMTNQDSKHITLLTKVRQSYGFPSSHVWMWELDHKEGWALKNWYFWTVVLEKTLESPLDCREINPVSPKRNWPWISIGKTDAEAEALILWPPDANSQLIGKDPDSGKDQRQEEKGTREDEMVGWHHWVNGYEFEPTLGDEWQGSLVSCSPWGCKSWIRLSDWKATTTPTILGLHAPEALMALGWEQICVSSRESNSLVFCLPGTSRSGLVLPVSSFQNLVAVISPVILSMKLFVFEKKKNSL